MSVNLFGVHLCLVFWAVYLEVAEFCRICAAFGSEHEFSEESGQVCNVRLRLNLIVLCQVEQHEQQLKNEGHDLHQGYYIRCQQDALVIFVQDFLTL